MFEISSYTGGIAETNGWLLQTETGVLAFDAPDGMAAWLAERKIRLDALFLTHQHFDHVMDAAEIKAAQGCPILAYASYSKSLTLEVLFGAVTGSSMSVAPFEVDQVLEGGEWCRLPRFLSSFCMCPVTHPTASAFMRLIWGCFLVATCCSLEALGARISRVAVSGNCSRASRRN